MDKHTMDVYFEILRHELVPALGCTEPGAIAYCAAKAAETLGIFPEHIDIKCSGNIVKNVKGVVVPNSGGLRGIEAAAILGAVGGNPVSALEVLDQITIMHIEKTKKLLAEKFCACHLQEGEGNLYIDVVMTGWGHSAQVIIKDSHTNIIYIKKDDRVLFEATASAENVEFEKKKELLTVKGIIDFAKTADVLRAADILEHQIEVNTAIAEEGLTKEYGASVGKTLLETYGTDIKIRAKAKAAAGSDARMNGCSMPVVINSGSGNQGITVTVPVVEYAKELNASKEELYRALLISNLISIHIKSYIGKLSAFCGAVSAACGSGAAISFLCGGDFDEISETITNTVANVGGIVCDGAKASCAAKIASALDAAIMGQNMAQRHRTFQSGEGLVTDDIEHTIRNIGHLGREGMRTTDTEILHMMIGDGNAEIC